MGRLPQNAAGRRKYPTNIRCSSAVNPKNQITTIFFDLFGVLLGADQSVVVQYLSQLTETPYLQTRENAMGEPFMRLERCEINFAQYVDEIRTLLPTVAESKKTPCGISG